MGNATSMNDSVKWRRCLIRAVQCAGALAVTAVMVFPLYWMIISSFKPTSELTQAEPTFWPRTVTLEAYRLVTKNYPIFRYLLNTLIVTLGIVGIQTFFGILAACSFSKGQYRGKNILFVFVLGALMIPIQVTFVPIYVMLSRISWLNTYMGLIVPESLSAYTIFLLRQSFMTVDDSYIEAGKIDGMGIIRVIFRILVPMCKPTVVTMVILSFINGWNAYFWPKMIITRDEMRTIALGIAEIRNSFLSMEVLNMNQIMAASCISVLPILILFLVFQKYILSGFSKAAMK